MNILIVDDEVTALRDMERVLHKVVPDALVKKADEAEAALALMRDAQTLSSYEGEYMS